MALSLCWILGSIAPVARAEVGVEVTRVGFPDVRQGTVLRYGTWTPIIVDVSLLRGEASFDGSLRAPQYDADGDQVYDLVPVHLRAETGGSQRYFLYLPANPVRSLGSFFVELLNEDGEAVEVISQGEPTVRARPAQQPADIRHDALFVLSLSDGVLGRLKDLVDLGDDTLYTRDVHLGHMSPVDLPELWIGLEAVDYIVWDDARPEMLTTRQLTALLEWVRRGGTLMIAASRSAPSLALTETINAVLPVDIGDIESISDLPKLRRRLLNSDEDDKGFAEPVPVARCVLRPEGSPVEPRIGEEAIHLTRRRVGLGHVVFSAITMKDLFSGETGSPTQFYRKLLYLRVVEQELRPQPQPVLFDKVVSAVSFSGVASTYFFLAGLFSFAYLLIATLGTWWFLGGRGWRRHSWSAFALVAMGVSVLSIGVVEAIQGGQALHQLSILDFEAGEGVADGTVLFGLKTGSDKRVDVWLPADPVAATQPGPTVCSLRPVSPGGNPADFDTGYVDPGEYRIVPGSAEIDDVRVRATLKQFEGRWHGATGGRLTAQIAVRRGPDRMREATDGGSRKELLDDLTDEPKSRRAPGLDRRITDDSYVVNELGVDLTDCYLIHPVSDEKGDRGEFIYVYPIEGGIPADGKRFMLAPALYIGDTVDAQYERMRKLTLKNVYNEWREPFRSSWQNLYGGQAPDLGFKSDPNKKALLILSIIGEHDFVWDAGWLAYVATAQTWSRDRLRQLDLRDRLDQESVVLIGFADAPGPIRLFMREGDSRYRPVEPDPRHSRTMYRIRIPAPSLDRRRGEPVEPDEDGPLRG